ncbi:MAG: hypothetical protein RIT28_2916 [Pseudomonadota bacterium]
MVRYGLLGGTSVLEAHLRQALAQVAVPVGAWPDHYAPVHAIEEVGTQLLFVNGTRDFEDALRVARSIAPHTRMELVMLGDADAKDHLLAAMRAGCRELLHPYRDAARLAEVVTELAERVAGQGEGSAEVITVTGSRGGVGVTTVALGLAHVIAQEKRNAAVVVDLDQAGGDLLSAINLKTGYTTHDLLANLSRLDVNKVRGAVVRKESGLWVLPQPEEDIDTTTVTEQDIAPLMGVLRRTFTHVIVDSGSAMADAGRAVLAEASHVVLVTDQEIVSLRTAVRRLKLLTDMGLEKDQLHVVLNRYNPRRKPDRDEIATQLKVTGLWTLANDYDAVNGALNEGVSVVEHAPRSAVSDDVRGLKAKIFGEKVEKKTRGWWLSR